jgi:CRP-like cAMP-binding protein
MQISTRNLLLEFLADDEAARVRPHLYPVTLNRDADLYPAGDEIQDVYFPETCVISQLHLFEDGGVAETSVTGREGVVGLPAVFDPLARASWIKVTVGGTAWRMSVDRLRQEFSRGGGLQRRLLAHATHVMRQLEQKAVCNGHHKVEARLCSWLLMMHDRVGNDRLPFTHEQIANRLDTRRPGVTVIAKRLRTTGGIAYRRGAIVIRDRRSLEAGACECYRILNRSKSPANLLDPRLPSGFATRTVTATATEPTLGHHALSGKRSA